ncbi:MAG: hypothetical protein FJX71_03630 [Alphaproteobacteria bacterium]|nr:hypothetical protein [Alphaproteobacteria bacterium]
MNEILRIFKRAFKLIGYDLKKAGKFTLLPLHQQPDIHLQRVYEAFDWEKQKIGGATQSNLNELVVIVRTCLRSNRNVDKRARFTGASTVETIYRCLRSTIRSINYAWQQKGGQGIKVNILDDHSDADYLKKINDLCKDIHCPWEIKTTREAGQGKSLYEQFEFAKSLDALCYFCEDDYLHEPSAIWEMWNFYDQVAKQTGRHLVLHPQECEFLYQTHYPSYILAGEKRHWRTMNHATHVLFTHSHVVKTFWTYFENTKHVGDRKKRQLGSESKTTNLLFKHIPGFCPIPAVAGHAQFELTLPPCFNWQKIWEENAN